MIRVEVIFLKGEFRSLTIKGHAESGPYGHDLVCAAMSAIVPGGFNALKGEYKIEVSKGFVSLEAPSGLSSHDQVVLETILAQISGISDSYPSYLTLERKEKA